MKKRQKNLLLGTGLLASMVLPITLTAVSCGTDNASTGNVVRLVTDSGDINDKSFNQQAAEALQTILGKTSLSSSDYQKPSGSDAASIAASYAAFKQSGASTIIAPGFYHVDAINLWNTEHSLDELKFIVADSSSFASNVAGIVYETKTSGFLAGYLASIYLVATSDHTPIVGTFGGGNFPGVTDFMTGFVMGVKYFNDNLINADIAFGGQKVTFAKFGTDDDYTNSGFTSGPGVSKANALLSQNADIILPVAGPQTADTISAIKTSTAINRTKVIGVDTNQALAYPADDSYFLTSIIKDVKRSIIDVYKKSVGEDLTTPEVDPTDVKGFGGTTVGTLANGWTGIAYNALGDALIGATTDKIYDLANRSFVKLAATAIKDVTWATALAYIKAN